MSLAFSPDSKRVVTGGQAAALRIWEVATGKELTEHAGHLHSVMDLTFSPDGKLLASRGGDATVRLWDWRAAKELHQFQLAGLTKNFFGKGASGSLLTFSPDGKYLAAGGRLPSGDPPHTHYVQLFDVGGRKEVGRWEEGLSEALGLSFSTDGSLLASASLFGVCLRAVPGGEQRAKMAASKPPSDRKHSSDCCVAFVPNNSLLATGAVDGVRWWDPVAKTQVGGFGTEAPSVGQLLFSPNGMLLLTFEGPGARINLYEAATGGKAVTVFKSNAPKGQDWVTVAWSPDGRLIATGGHDMVVRVWSALTCQELAKFEGHQGGVVSLAFSPDGKVLASGSKDSTILLWDVAGLAKLPVAVDLQDKELDQLWAKLQDKDSATVYQAAARLVAGRHQAVTYLRKHLPVATDPDAKKVQQWLDDLDHEKNSVRLEANSKLQQLGSLIEPALQQRLKEKVSAEARQRIEGLLKKFKTKPVSADERRQCWALVVLEYIASPQARALLTDLAGGAAGAPLTRGAKAALKRLALLD
jgi:WD40 repeat protein